MVLAFRGMKNSIKINRLIESQRLSVGYLSRQAAKHRGLHS